MEAKVRLKEASERWKKHVITIEKEKEKETLDLKDDKFNSEEKKCMTNKERMLKSLKKTIARNSDFRHLT